MCNAISELGHEVTLLTPDAKYRIEKDVEDVFQFYGVNNGFRIKKLLFPKFKGRVYIYAMCIWHQLRKHKPDLVVGRSVQGCWVATMLGFPTVFDSHGPIWESGVVNTLLFKQMIKRRSFVKMTVNSLALKNIYTSSKVVQQDTRIEVAHNGARLYGGERTNLPGKNTFKAGYFGHLYPGRGLDVIIEVAKNMNDIDFVIVGGTDKEVAEWKERTKSYNNIFLLGFKPPSDVYKYRNSCDVLLAPYQSKVAVAGGKGDSSKYMNPIKLLEYLSSRKPIIASDLTPIREVLNEGNAVLIESDNVRAWLEALNRLKDNVSLSHKLSEKAFTDYTLNYTWTARAEKLVGDNPFTGH